MAHKVVKILTSDDGEPRDKELQVWHYATSTGDGPRTFCEGEVFGYGESACEFKEKISENGGITCDKCLYKIKLVKSIKL